MFLVFIHISNILFVDQAWWCSPVITTKDWENISDILLIITNKPDVVGHVYNHSCMGGICKRLLVQGQHGKNIRPIKGGGKIATEGHKPTSLLTDTPY